MPVNLDNKISKKDLARAHKKKNPPEYEEGFGPEDAGEDSFSVLFADDEKESSNGSGGGFGVILPNTQGGESNTTGMNGLNGINNPSNLMNPMMQGINNGLNPLMQGMNNGVNQNQQPRKKSNFEQATDAFIDTSVKATIELSKSFFSIFKDLPTSVKIRTAEEWGYFGRNLLLFGIALTLIGGFFTLFNRSQVAIRIFSVGLLNIGTAFGLLGFSSISILNGDAVTNLDFSKLPNSSHDFGMSQASYEKAMTELDFECQDTEEELFVLDDDEDDYNTNLKEAVEVEEERKEENLTATEYEDSLNQAENNVVEDLPYLSRSLLVDTFKPLLEKKNPHFSDVHEIDPDSDQFNAIEILLQKALASAQGKSFEEITAELVKAEETAFVMIFRMERVSGLNKLDAIEREVEAYFREDSKDTSVTAQVLLEGDNYKIEVQKGESGMVTWGDCMNNRKVEQFIRDTSKKLPFIAGVTAAGKPLLLDAKGIDSYMIAGKPRSGKSWSILSYLMSFIMWNTPSDIQFVIIDPKESQMFNVMSCLPHVRGLHSTNNILEIMRDLIEVEGARRKKLLKDNECENVWDLKEKGVALPILVLVIDEIMTIVKSLPPEDVKEFNNLLIIILTQLPSLGIRPMIAPHRAQGVLDKTLRTNISFRSAIRADEAVVKETLDINKWTIPLKVPGSSAIACDDFDSVQFAYGVALSTSNVKNTNLIKAVARIFYKMGVEIPEMADLPHIFNQDLEKVKKMLNIDVANRVQMSANTTVDFERDSVYELQKSINYSREDFEEEFNRVGDKEQATQELEDEDDFVEEEDLLEDHLW